MKVGPTLSTKEHLILRMLTEHGEMYGLEMVKASRGGLRRGTVYVTLARMADKGFLQSRQHKDGKRGLPKRVFWATGKGRAIFEGVNGLIERAEEWKEGTA